MSKIIVTGLIVVVAAILIMLATRPDTFRVERSIRVSAPPEKIFHYVNDFHQWGVWSPYERLDPSMKRSYDGTPSGKGAVYEWDGHNRAAFDFQPVGSGTRVTWSMDGPSPYIAKVMGLFFNMDRLIGGDFETGLANLKAVSET
jgi:hypothetical protein